MSYLNLHFPINSILPSTSRSWTVKFDYVARTWRKKNRGQLRFCPYFCFHPKNSSCSTQIRPNKKNHEERYLRLRGTVRPPSHNTVPTKRVEGAGDPNPSGFEAKSIQSRNLFITHSKIQSQILRKNLSYWRWFYLPQTNPTFFLHQLQTFKTSNYILKEIKPPITSSIIKPSIMNLDSNPQNPQIENPNCPWRNSIQKKKKKEEPHHLLNPTMNPINHHQAFTQFKPHQITQSSPCHFSPLPQTNSQANP